LGMARIANLRLRPFWQRCSSRGQYE
jgi:hypothetical protein